MHVQVFPIVGLLYYVRIDIQTDSVQPQLNFVNPVLPTEILGS